MAKKLKYPYEQWKEQQNKPSSRSPSPMEAVEDEGFSSSSSSPQTVIPHVSMSDYQETFVASRHIYGKWCSMLHDRGPLWEQKTNITNYTVRGFSKRNLNMLTFELTNSFAIQSIETHIGGNIHSNQNTLIQKLFLLSIGMHDFF